MLYLIFHTKKQFLHAFVISILHLDSKEVHPSRILLAYESLLFPLQLSVFDHQTIDLVFYLKALLDQAFSLFHQHVHQFLSLEPYESLMNMQYSLSLSYEDTMHSFEIPSQYFYLVVLPDS